MFGVEQRRQCDDNVLWEGTVMSCIASLTTSAFIYILYICLSIVGLYLPQTVSESGSPCHVSGSLVAI